MHASRPDVIRSVAIRETPLAVDDVRAAVADPAAGGVVVFVGTVREQDQGKGVVRLGYQAHPSAGEVLSQVVEKIAAGHDVGAVAAEHRVGELEIGDVAVVVAASAAHRGEAFAAAQQLIDDLKATVPIWKRQDFTDGTTAWVGSP
ncbi:MAG: molybdenum cofactor biosynthesis protein MoaE [Streptosporangiales bacterium]|nr:molybdenum cofactor biosynthesis protein MoaE [Streptosporangiales bacterium]